ncbi:transposase family protein [Chryseobacterium sp. StRB126]|nr:transposase family protein [Chryseobacterium sp. StRB126]
MLGDKGDLSSEVQVDLFNYANITLETPKIINQKAFKPQFYLFKKHRKRIETLFSQLCDQFMIRRNYVKTFEGFKTRVLAKITLSAVG